jgi:hypothetical protein
VNESFFKFPHTPHLLWLGPGTPRDDKVLGQARAKVVSIAFKQQIEEHWTRRAAVPNLLAAIHV